EIAFPGVAGGHGWVFKDAVKVTGNVFSIPATDRVDFGYPTLTPTQQMVVAAPPPWATGPAIPDQGLQQLGTQIFDYLLNAKFSPGTDRQASAFLMDLRSGQAVSLNPGVAYSGMSLIKIPILIAVYRALNGLPTPDQAQALGEMMICSSNENTNAILALIGNGNVLTGVQNVTDTMHALGLQDTFLSAPLMTDPKATPAPVSSLKTGADQVSTDPDPFNQATPADLGDALTAIYQCAKDGSGPLVNTFGSQFTINKCRAMILLMSSDKIGVMVEAGVPPGITVAHKHGWVPETHGDAAIVFTPGGDFVLTVAMRQKTWLDYTDSFPKISEIARMVYNTYNPTAPLAQIHPQTVPDTCTLDPALLNAVQSPNTLPMP
ncbi:MAG: serine hydrolase, partial [Aggregatilineales bacterium]